MRSLTPCKLWAYTYKIFPLKKFYLSLSEDAKMSECFGIIEEVVTSVLPVQCDCGNRGERSREGASLSLSSSRDAYRKIFQI